MENFLDFFLYFLILSNFNRSGIIFLENITKKNKHIKKWTKYSSNLDP